VFHNRVFARLCIVPALIAVVSAVAESHAADDVEEFRVYSWSSLGTADRDTSASCRSINKKKGEPDWAIARREVADVSDLELPDDQKEGTAYRVFVDYCVHQDSTRERPVGAMIFKAAPIADPDHVQRWGNRHYRTTSRSGKRVPKPGREHFDPPNFKRTN
jgi:hypothetical protein